MKRFIVGLACMALMAVSCVDALAGVWLSNDRAGSISGSFDGLSPTSGDLTVPISVTDFIYNTTPGSRNGAFFGITEPSTMVWAGLKNFDGFGLTVGDAYVFTSATFGTFTGTVTVEGGTNVAGPGTGNRTLDFTGIFTPGSNVHYEGDSTSLSGATLQVSFSRNLGGSINAAWSMDTTAAAPVPEPTSIAIFALGAAGFADRRFRRK
jgi:hypothetical protein